MKKIPTFDILPRSQLLIAKSSTRLSTLIRHPFALSPTELDHLLAQGWRPSGQSVYTADFIRLDEVSLISVLPTRLPLIGTQLSKSSRKLLRRNGRLFRVQIRESARITPEKRRVNERYAAEQPDKTLEMLEYHLFSQHGHRVLQTSEVEVYYDNKLVGFSFFDRGECGVYSKAGIYDPDFRQYSLGLYTLLLEVVWARERGYYYFYPGYVSPDNSSFDYKHRIGPLEFWQLEESRWCPFREFRPQQDHPLWVNYQRLLQLQQALTQVSITTRLFQYAYLDYRYHVEHGAYYLDYPLLLHVTQVDSDHHWIMVYHNVGKEFRWLEVRNSGLHMMRRSGQGYQGLENYSEPLLLRTVHLAHPSVDQLVGELRRRLRPSS